MREELRKGKSESSEKSTTEIETDQAESNLDIAMGYIESSMFSDAEAYLNNALQAGKDKPLVLNYLGIVYFNQSDYTKAEKRFCEALHTDPDMVDVYFNLGVLYQKQGRFGEAIPCYKMVIEDNPDDAEAYYRMGQCAQRSGMTQDAKAFLNESFRLSLMPKVALDLIILYITQREYNEATQMLDYLTGMINNQDKIDSEELQPLINGMESLYSAMGVLLKKQDKHEEAIQSFYNAIMINDQNKQTYNYLGECYLEIGLDQEAESLFFKASKLDSSYLQPILNLGRLYLKQNKFFQTIIAMEKLLKVSVVPPTNGRTDNDLVELDQDTTMGQETNPFSRCTAERELAYNILGQAYTQLGEREKAIKAFEASIKMDLEFGKRESINE